MCVGYRVRVSAPFSVNGWKSFYQTWYKVHKIKYTCLE